jgi:hypothetical protein
VHEYKVTRGSGSVVVLFRSRGYTHVDKQPDIDAGNKNADRFAGYILSPKARPTSEIKHHQDTAPGVRYVFVDGRKLPEAGFYTVVRTVAAVSKTQAEYVDKHRHNCDTYHIAIGTGPSLGGLQIEFVIGDEKVEVESPVGVHVPANVPHSQRIVGGSGHFFNFVPKSNYNDSLA